MSSTARSSRLLRGGQLHLLGNGASGATSASAAENIGTTSSSRTTRGLRLLASAPATSRSKTIMTGGGVNGNRIAGVAIREKTTAAAGGHKKILNADNVFENLVKMEYAVRGPLLIRALEIEKELQKGVKKPFNEVIKANIGDSHAMGQKPVTFLRQVLVLTLHPELLDDPKYPEDAKQRARAILEACRGSSMGAYTESPGIDLIRKHVAKYIEKRDDGVPCDYKNIILSNGATDSIKSILKLFMQQVDGKATGVLIPIPQYPLYTATLAEFGLQACGYYLNEDDKWSLEISELERVYKESLKTTAPRVLVVINPGNPTGQVLSRKNIEEVIKFAHNHNLFIMADEVYQDNIYHKDCCFHSFKKVMNEMGEPYVNMEIASFMSISKGYMGECGLRGGYAEIVNMDPAVMAVLQKSISALLCPTTVGQVAMDVVVNPPNENEPSYQLFQQEKENILSSLAERSRLVVDTVNDIPGYHANPAMGAMYVFPRVEIPEKAIKEAKAAGQTPDAFYAFKLLENTGICVIPGSGFGQKPGTYHFRTTILPQKEKIKTMLSSLKEFHVKFLKEYS